MSLISGGILLASATKQHAHPKVTGKDIVRVDEAYTYIDVDSDTKNVPTTDVNGIYITPTSKDVMSGYRTDDTNNRNHQPVEPTFNQIELLPAVQYENVELSHTAAQYTVLIKR